MADALGEFLNLIMRNLEKNGYPNNPVSLPSAAMMSHAEKGGFSFDKARELLKLNGVATEMNGPRVVFSVTSDELEVLEPEVEEPEIQDESLQAAAQEMFGRMSAEEQAKLFEMVQNMDPSMLENMKKQWESMPGQEKSRMMNDLKTNGLPL